VRQRAKGKGQRAKGKGQRAKGKIMTLNAKQLTDRILLILEQRPFTSLKSIANELKLDRHTITGKLKKDVGKSYETLQDDLIRRVVNERLSEPRFLELKDLATALDTSPSVLRRRFRKLGITWAPRKPRG
jgi:hypothetical protein